MASQPQHYVIDGQGKKTAVLVPIKKYQKLLADLHDLAVAAERKAEKPVKIADMKKRLKKDGVL